MANTKHIPVVKFHKRKYGEELLIDIVTLETIRRSLHFTGVQFYASRLAVTSNYLNRIVRQSLGQSTKQYIQNRRIEEAKRLLRYTSLPISDIAEKLNYDTASYFVRAFSKATGTTPLQYRATAI